MPKTPVSLLVLMLTALSTRGSAQTPAGPGEERLIDIQKSTVTVRVFKSGLFRAFADDHVIQAPLLEGSLNDMPHVQLVIDARRMRVLDPGLSPKDRNEVQTRMLGPEVLDVDRFEQIRFHSITIQQLDPGGWRVEGELELHGQIRPVTAKVVLERGHFRGSTSLKQSTFGITPISIVGGTVKVKDEVRIDFDIVAAEP
jgi:YceI-like domain